MFNQDLIRKIKEANRIEDVAVEFGVVLKDNKALCPFHEEKHGSFSIEPNRQIARCFACMPKAVDVIGLVMKFKDCSFGEAIMYLAKRANIEIDPLTPEEEIAIQKFIRKKEILRVTAQFYHDRLVENNYKDGLGYIKERGFTKDILDFFMVGLAGNSGLRDHLVSSGYKAEDCIEAGVLAVDEKSARVYDFFRDRLIFSVMVKEEVVSITARTLKHDFEPKWLHLKGEINNFYNEDTLQLKDDILICEGPSDTLAAVMKGYDAVGILGAMSFKEEYLGKFKKEAQIYICLDSDDAGRDGTKQISEVFMGEEKIILLPQGQDLTDYFKTHTIEQFEGLKKQAKNWQETKLDEEQAIQIHLNDTDDAKYSDKKAKVDVMVCAKGETFHVPKVYRAKCDKNCKNNCCPINNRSRRYYIPSNSKELIDFTMFSDERITARLRALIYCTEDMRKRSCINIEIVERVTIQEILVVPKTSRIDVRQDGERSIVIDELGKEYRDKKIYVQASLPKTNQYFRIHGWVKSSPKSQIATLLIYKLEPISNDYENFQLTDKVKQEFKVFQVIGNYTIESKLDEILEDITNNITKIYGDHRKRVLLCMLLTYCSQIAFEFDEEVLKRGWVEMFLIGDTGQGKTQMYDNLSKAMGLGEFISGTAASRSGIVYACVQVGGTWFLIWGKYPLNDGKLLFIDEGQALDIEEWEKMSSGRSDGIVRADRVKQGEHPSRTRLIISCNPKNNMVLDDNMCGVETLTLIFRMADIRRFDIGAFMSSSDQSSDIVNLPSRKRSHSAQKISPAILRNLICWAWTRKTENILFEEEAKDKVFTVAKELTNLYGSAKNIPLVTTDVRHKIARLSVALATLLHSTDVTYEKVIVRGEHVDYISKLMQEMFNHENCCLDVYAELKRENTALSDDEYKEFIDMLIEEGMGRSGNGHVILNDDTRIIFLDFANNDVVERSQLADALDIDADNVSKKLKILKDYSLIRGRSGKRGYRKTAKFNKILRRMLSDKSLQRVDYQEKEHKKEECKKAEDGKDALDILQKIRNRIHEGQDLCQPED